MKCKLLRLLVYLCEAIGITLSFFIVLALLIRLVMEVRL